MAGTKLFPCTHSYTDKHREFIDYPTTPNKM